MVPPMVVRILAVFFAGALLLVSSPATALQVQSPLPAPVLLPRQAAPNTPAPPAAAPAGRPTSSPVQASVRAPTLPPPVLKVKWEAGKLSLDAEGVPLWEVLQVVSRQSGIVVTGAQGLRDPVYAHFTGIELRRALQGLLSRLDYAIIAGPGGAAASRGMRVVVFRGDTSSESAAIVAKRPAETSSEPQDVKLKAIEEATKTGDRGTLRKYLPDADPAVQTAAFDALALEDKDAAIAGIMNLVRNGSDTMIRLQALQLLDQSGVADEASMISTLRDVLQNTDPSLGAYAIQSLAGRGTPDALDALSDGLRSGDASVRLMVVESVAQTPAGLPLLREAASDPDEAVSTAATTLLKQAEAAAGPDQSQ